MNQRRLFASATLVLLISACAKTEPPVSASMQPLVERARAAGATDLRAHGGPDGGLVLSGKLDGRRFAAALPANWNQKTVLHAHGYSVPGTSIKVPDDPLATDLTFGLFRTAYGQGYAVGQSEYDKAGMGVKTGAERTLRLKRWFDAIGSREAYITGVSMGGNVVMALIEQNPQDFAGGLAACGVMDDWPSEVGALTDMRALYNYFTRGTRYELPGDPDLAVSAISPTPPAGLSVATPLWHMLQLKRLLRPVIALFEAADANPSGSEAAIIRNVQSASGIFDADLASFGWPLVTITLGQDDMVATFGGNVYGNEGKVYRSAHLTADENARLNAAIQRIKVDPAAVERAARWYQSTGTSPVKLVSIHNAIDSLVPYGSQQALQQRMESAGNADNLLLITVPATRNAVPGSSKTGYTHCGFTTEQTVIAWNALRSWVETGQRPVIARQ
ncbi:MAG: hypothetical protein ACR2I8_04930 [Steroidobacteraceae bacterium]